VAKTAKAIGVGRRSLGRSLQIASILPEAKSEAIKGGLDDNQTALLEIAAITSSEAQVQKARELVAAKTCPQSQRPKSVKRPISTPRVASDAADPSGNQSIAGPNEAAGLDLGIPIFLQRDPAKILALLRVEYMASTLRAMLLQVSADLRTRFVRDVMLSDLSCEAAETIASEKQGPNRAP
jgi:hypothetical protein